MPKRKLFSTWIREHGIEVRIFERRPKGPIWREVKLGRVVSENGTSYTSKDRKALGHSDRKRAEKDAGELCAALATARLISVTPDNLTLGQLARLYLRERGPALKPYRRKYAAACFAMFVEAWGEGQRIVDIGQAHVDRYCRLRRTGELVPPSLRPPVGEDAKPGRGYRAAGPVRDGTLHSNLIGFLSPAFNWAMRYKVNGRRLLTVNPLHDCDVPKEKNPRRPIASHARYVATQQHADAVDAMGRLRCLLALARYTGRRESAICQLRASDILLSGDQVRASLAAEGMDERLAEHMPNGAIRWSASTDKAGLRFVAALGRDARAAVDAYLRRNPRMGDVPLFPAPGDGAKPLRKETASSWLMRAEALAKLPKLERGAFHAYRRLWASERKHLPDVDVAAAGGWKDPQTMKASYQQADGATMLRVIERQA